MERIQTEQSEFALIIRFVRFLTDFSGIMSLVFIEGSPMNFETENIEFKAQFAEEIYKEVIAFVNTDGGA